MLFRDASDLQPNPFEWDIFRVPGNRDNRRNWNSGFLPLIVDRSMPFVDD